jgi:glycosyltransferase involved in cell wall biosynthesis
VCVVTPAYNASRYLQATIDSVLAQTYPNFEYVIVDNRSTDDTAAIAQRAADRDSRIRVLSELEQGIAPARNCGVSSSNSEFIAFVDADDVWEPAFLERTVAILQSASRDTVGVFVGISIIDADGQHQSNAPLPSGTYPPARFLAESNPAMCGSTLLLRRSALAAVGPFDQAMSPVEDMHQWLEMMATTPNGHFLAVSQHLCSYRRHPDAITANSDAGIVAGLAHLITKWSPLLDRQAKASASARPAYLAAKVGDHRAGELLGNVVRGGWRPMTSPIGRAALARFARRSLLHR